MDEEYVSSNSQSFDFSHSKFVTLFQEYSVYHMCNCYLLIKKKKEHSVLSG